MLSHRFWLPFEGCRSSFMDYYNIKSTGLNCVFSGVFRLCGLGHLSNNAFFLGLCFKVAVLHKTCGLPFARLPSSLEHVRASAFSGAKRRIQHKTTSQIHNAKNIEKRNHPPRLYRILRCVAGVAL